MGKGSQFDHFFLQHARYIALSQADILHETNPVFYVYPVGDKSKCINNGHSSDTLFTP